MGKQRHFTLCLLPALCLLALSASWAACSAGSNKEPEVGERPELHLEFTPDAATFSPLSGRLATFTVTISGFKNEADANSVGLNVNVTNGLTFTLDEPPATRDSRTFTVTLKYGEEGTFDEGVASLRLSPATLPGHYEYYGKVKTIHLAIVNGKTRERAIPVTQANLRAFNHYANTEDGLKLHYRLAEDVVLEAPVAPETSNWEPIGKYNADGPYDDEFIKAFTGSFDGEGHTLAGLTIHNPYDEEQDDEQSDYQGLFGLIGEGAIIENLGLIGLSVKGNNNVGGLVGYNHQGTVQNSHASGNVEGNHSVGGLMGFNGGGTVQNSHASGSVKDGNEHEGQSLGGLVGTNHQGTIQNSHATCNVSGGQVVGGLVGGNNEGGRVENSYATGGVNGEGFLGGLLGSNGGIVQNSYATGNVKGSWGAVGGLAGNNSYGGTVHGSYARGKVEGGSGVGGLVGENYETVENSYATGNVEGKSGDSTGGDRIGGLVGWNYRGPVRNSYATGSVAGVDRVGGLVGENNYDGDEYSGTVQNCVALNPSVAATDTDTDNVGRVAGLNESVLSNNRARNMSITKTILGNGDSNGVDGQLVPAGPGTEQYNNFSFWIEGMGWKENVWQWGPNNLPILRNAGGEQNHTAP